ncbi:hypothetical protein MAR_023480 [Mya arenaria]|uniref:Uncharacterized protein n=1 Tax=Mya arenaria TaxID=6604 RepID=A0ABY7DQW2_MYAAR|nr:hypothetical protein MAR_023480 [Mya arenaria]
MSEAKKMSKALVRGLRIKECLRRKNEQGFRKGFRDNKMSEAKKMSKALVEEIKKKAEEEEQRRIEAELASKKKRSHRQKDEEGEKTQQ